jgi:hypothetical protein
VARAYGFDSWPKLKGHVDGITAKQFIAAARANDVDRVAGILKLRPDLTDSSGRTAMSGVRCTTQ